MIVEERDGLWAWALLGLAYLVAAVLASVMVVGLVVALVVARCRNAETTEGDRTPADGRR